ncbi:MAG: hypothetical protein ACE5H2_07640 [Terriglobia bacterium]
MAMAQDLQAGANFCPFPRVRVKQRPREDLDPEIIAQIVSYGLLWIAMLGMAVASVALAMGRLRLP